MRSALGGYQCAERHSAGAPHHKRIYIIEGEKKHTELVINDPKTPNSIREIPLSAEALSLIKPLMKKVVNTGFYVIANDSRPIEPRTYRS